MPTKPRNSEKRPQAKRKPRKTRLSPYDPRYPISGDASMPPEKAMLKVAVEYWDLGPQAVVIQLAQHFKEHFQRRRNAKP